MGIDIIIKYINLKLNISLKKYNGIYYFINKEGKIIFFFGYKSLNDIEKFIDTLDMDNFYDEFKNFLSVKDKETYINFKAFLWDLYIVGINCGKVESIKEEEKFNLEKDRFIARKIIIDFINEDIINKIKEYDEKIYNESILDTELSNTLSDLINEIEMIVEPEKKLNEFIDDNNNTDDNVDSLIKEILLDDGMRKRIIDVNRNSDLSLKEMILNYLEYISNVENFIDKEE